MYCISEVLIVDVILGCARSQPDDVAACSQQLSSCHVIVFVLLPDLEEPPVHFFEDFPVYPSAPTQAGGLSDPLFLPHGATGGRARKTLGRDALLDR
ncbi:hypothetical protein DPMN_031458 [Dreissena polymorpha]|uniref:Secreted protein n=1 Tax=Dreissena polymorpha TaxID=45954 RepID=A0A9D4M1Z1_DREPO|nr:hypothetical protein DPMN_031458 [Dreissena polymorpha]